MLISYNLKRLAGKEIRQVKRNGVPLEAEIKVFSNQFAILGYPIFSFGKSYSIRLSETNEYYESGLFNKMPAELLEQCKEVGRKY